MTAGAALWPGVAGARTIGRGIADPFIISMPADQQADALHEIRSELGATYVRFFVDWAKAQPLQVPYEPASPYMAGVASAVSQARADGLRVIITFMNVPKWASDKEYWTWPTMKGGYQPYGAMDTTYLPAFRAFCQDVATQFQDGHQVYAYECWNEPNLWRFIYPQSKPHDSNFGAHLYVKMLTSCFKGIRAGDPHALVVAGGTAPRGSSGASQGSASPLRFAGVIKAAGVSKYFDAYSHHPYTPGGSPRLWPEAAPRDPKATVSLQNLGTLLRLFPKKPFLLTEYGYQTAACRSFTGQHVNQVTQALYLRRAYAYAARYPQVKLLMWFLVKDFSPQRSPYDGFYTGLRTADGTPKRAWYVFARGNHLTLSAPASIKSGATLTLIGKVSCESVGGVAGTPLVVERRKAGSWSTVKTVYSGAEDVYTGPAGHYTVGLRPKASAYYRVTWRGVVTSPTRYVKVK